MRFFWCILSALLIVSYLSGGHALLEQCSGQGDCDAKEPFSVCVGGNCSCTETHREIENSCTAKTCTTANVTANCGTNLYCTSDAVCACAATYEILPNGRSCVPKTCTASTSCAGADSNSYCDTALSSPACKCKMNYNQPNTKNCTIKACGTNTDCTVTNAYCETGTNAGCTCGITTNADSTTGACTSKTCEVSAAITSNTSCGALNAECELSPNAYQCACGANYEPGATSCTQKACTTANNCGADSVCTNSLCVCKSGFVASGSRCKKSCKSSTECSSNAGCVNGVCECFGNFEGNGETCTAMSCAGTATTTCHPNSVCTSSVCKCDSGYVAKATACFKTCNSSSECSSHGQCTDGKCICNNNFVGDGLKCIQKACEQNSECKMWSKSVCTAGKCVDGAITVVCSFSSMLFAFLMTLFVSEI